MSTAICQAFRRALLVCALIGFLTAALPASTQAEELDLNGYSVIVEGAYKRSGFEGIYGWLKGHAGLYFAKTGDIYAFDDHFDKNSHEGSIIGKNGGKGVSNFALKSETHQLERRGNLLRLTIRQKATFHGEFVTTYIIDIDSLSQCRIRAFKIEGWHLDTAKFRGNWCKIAPGKQDF